MAAMFNYNVVANNLPVYLCDLKILTQNQHKEYICCSALLIYWSASDDLLLTLSLKDCGFDSWKNQRLWNRRRLL